VFICHHTFMFRMIWLILLLFLLLLVSVKSLFLSENQQEKVLFLSKGFNFKDSNLVCILHPLTAKTSWVTAWYSKYYTSLNVPKKISHFDSWKNNFKTALRSGNMLICIKFPVLLKVFSLDHAGLTAIFFGYLQKN
jgi:hypothetical protein